MHGGKAILLILGVLLLVVSGLFLFVPAARPGIVQGWVYRWRGFSPATSPDDALGKLKKALEQRDYKAASLYLAGDYKADFDSGASDGEALANEIDNLRSAMKAHGVKSPRGQFVLFMLDPFPSGFKFTTSGSGDSATATLDWTGELLQFEGEGLNSIQDWQMDARICNSLLPRVAVAGSLQVAVKKEKDGWRIYLPVQIGDRTVQSSIAYLRSNGSNYKNALQGLKNDVKNEAPTKENFENALKTKLTESK